MRLYPGYGFCLNLMVLRLGGGFPALGEQGADLAPTGADLADTGASAEELGASTGPHGIAVRCGAQALCRRAQGLRRRAQTLWTWAQASDMRRKLSAARLGACELALFRSFPSSSFKIVKLRS
jgi:hypothetical protein